MAMKPAVIKNIEELGMIPGTDNQMWKVREREGEASMPLDFFSLGNGLISQEKKLRGG